VSGLRSGNVTVVPAGTGVAGNGSAGARRPRGAHGDRHRGCRYKHGNRHEGAAAAPLQLGTLQRAKRLSQCGVEW
jgi:hypothetical protein